MNWTNREKDYLIDNMELISDLIRKRMKIKEAIECQQAISSFSFVIQKRGWNRGTTFQPHSNSV